MIDTDHERESDREARDDCRCMTACSCAPFVLDGHPLTAPIAALARAA